MSERSTSRPRSLAGVCVLLVEDDGDSSDALRFMLERNGAEVHCAATAEEGREAFARRRPDILISDLAMPGEDGFAFLASVRALTVGEGGKVPAMAFSAMSPDGARKRAYAVGFQVFLRKPDDVPLIVPTVRRLVPALVA